MAAPGTVTDPNNPYRSVVGPTWAGGTRANAINYLKPGGASIAKNAIENARRMAQAGGQTPIMGGEEFYGQAGTPSYGQGHQGYGGYQPQPQQRIGYRGPLMQAGGSSPSGLANLYNMQRPGQGAYNNLQDQATVQHWGAGTPTMASYELRERFPQAFGYDPAYDPKKFLAGNVSPSDPRYGSFGASTMGAPMGSGESAGAASSWSGSNTGPQDWLPQQQDQMQDPNSMYGGARAMGGPVGPKPYLVGEKGPEIYKTNSGQMHMVGQNGPEITSFPEDGRIIPNKDIKKYLPARVLGGGVKGSPYTPMSLGPAQGYSQPQVPISPFAMAFVHGPQPQVDPRAAQFANDPNAPDNPWAMARYVRMGLQQQARYKLATDAVQRLQGQQAANPYDQFGPSGGGYTPPMHLANPMNPMLSINTGNPKNTAYMIPGRVGQPIRGMFNTGMGSVPMSAGSDPMNVTFPQANLMDQIRANPQPAFNPANPNNYYQAANPLAALFGE